MDRNSMSRYQSQAEEVVFLPLLFNTSSPPPFIFIFFIFGNMMKQECYFCHSYNKAGKKWC